ncbi:MAG: MFS transporter [Alphaproteobacteria bacterium]
MAKLTDFSAITRALGQRNFRIYTYGASVSLVGTWVQRVAQGWLTWELTHSFVWLGVIAAAELLPSVVLAPVAGAITDRIDRKMLAVLSQILACLQAATLSALIYFDLMNIWVLLALAAFVGGVFSFSMAVRLAIFPSLVERPHISSAIAINAAIFNLARFIGPALGGFLIANWGMAFAFGFNALSFFGFIVALSRIRMLRSETAGKPKAGLLADVAEGVRYAIRHPGIGPALLILVAVALGIKGVLEMLPGYVDDVLAAGVEAFAQMTAASGIGAAIAAVWIAGRGRLTGLTRLSLLYLLISAVAVAIFAAWSDIWVGLVCMFVLGAGITVIGTAVQSLMQNAVEGVMRGRVMSLYGVLFRGGPALGALLMGGLAEAVGLRTTFAVATAFTAIMTLWLWRSLPRMTAVLEAEPDPEKSGGW